VLARSHNEPTKLDEERRVEKQYSHLKKIDLLEFSQSIFRFFTLRAAR
jgi:hypothetical protein